MVPAPHPALQVPPTAPANSTSATPMATDPASDPSRKRKADVLEGSPKKQAVSKTDEVASVLQVRIILHCAPSYQNFFTRMDQARLVMRKPDVKKHWVY